MAQMVKNLPAMRESWVQSVGWEDPLEKGMATHSSILAWRTPWTKKPGRLLSTGSQRVIYNWMIFISLTYIHSFLDSFAIQAITEYWEFPVLHRGSLSVIYFIYSNMYMSIPISQFTTPFPPWRRKWQPTPVFLPGESQGRRSLVGCSLWGCRVGHNWSDLVAVAAATINLFSISLFLLYKKVQWALWLSWLKHLSSKKVCLYSFFKVQMNLFILKSVAL